jgi:hypothetical protein
MALKSSFRASLTVEGNQVGNTFWDAFMGGKYSQTETKYTPFDGVLRTFVGKPETENITLEANYEEAVHGPIVAHIGDRSLDYRGKKAIVTVYDLVPLSNPQQYVQNRAPYEGLVLDIVPPDGDSNDASTIVKIQIVISVGSLAVG